MDAKRKDSFVVYAGDLKEVVDELSDEQVATLFRAMIDYQLTGENPELTGVLKFAFIPIRQTMERNNERYEAKCQKNRENIMKRWAREKEAAFIRPYTKHTDNDRDNDRDNERDSDSDNDRESAEADVWSLSLSVLSHLNDATGSSWRVDDAASVRLISDLAHKGYTEDQMLEVIDKKAADWLGDPKVEQYLRPSTLFGQKFEQYLNQPDSARKKERDEARSREQAREQTRKQVEIYEQKLTGLRSEYEDAAGNMPLRLDIKGRIAVCEAELESLRARIGG